MGSRIPIAAFTDPSPAAQVASLQYEPRIQALLRAASWNFARAQATLTVWKQATANGVVSANPPPQPWLFSYLLPPDSLRARFLLPTVPVQPPGTPLTTAPNQVAWIAPAPTGIPFVVATDFDSQSNPISVILTNLCNAQLVYTRDLSQTPDLWDDLFLSAATSYLSCYFISALARNDPQLQLQTAQTKGLLDQARVLNGDEEIGSVDRVPDWMAARRTTGHGYWNSGVNPGAFGGGWGASSVGFPDGLRY